MSEHSLQYLYPPIYGTFIGLKGRLSNHKAVICTCAKPALKSYISMGLMNDIDCVVGRGGLFDPYDFALELLAGIPETDDVSVCSMLEYFNFVDGSCHKCQHIVPEQRYCNPMYGGLFKQYYGYYVNLQSFELGVHPRSGLLTPRLFSQSIARLFRDSSEELREYLFAYSSAELREHYYDSFYMSHALCQSVSWELQEKMKAVHKAIENEARKNLGFKVVGKGGISEQILYFLVKNIFPNKEIRRRSRPSALNGLELDIFLPEYPLGIEFQGQQHYKKVNHWGGEAALKNQQARDRKKKRLCKKNGIKLVFFTYKDFLCHEIVKRRLSHFLL